ncbi:MAG: hypothetical protein ACRD02_00735 [Acidimicrobiia bacterium]
MEVAVALTSSDMPAGGARSPARMGHPRRPGPWAGVAGLSAVIQDGFISLLGRLGYQTSLPRDPESWLVDHPEGTLLIPALGLFDLAAHRHPDALIVAVVEPDAPPDSYRQAIRSGAASILTPAMSPEEVDLALRAARLGYQLLPRQATEALAVRLVEVPASLSLDHDELILLRRLAGGVTLDELARDLDLSTRQTRRRLKALWARLEAQDRTIALIKATRWGLLDPEVLDP